jgi:SAM-dependent methyltransferase
MEWFEDEGFWKGLYPYLFSAERMALAAGQVAQILALAPPAGREVLDLCCGPGRHAVEFAQLGYHVTGVDRSPFLLGQAAGRAAEAGVAVEWVREDMRVFRRPAAFDLACNLFTSFGYFEREGDDISVLRNLHDSLRPGGALVMDLIGKERLARRWENSLYTEFTDGTTVLMRPRVLADWCRVENYWTVLGKDGTHRTYRFEHTIYSGRELKELLVRAGFGDVRLFGDLGGSPYGIDAARLIAVARKQE